MSTVLIQDADKLPEITKRLEDNNYEVMESLSMRTTSPSELLATILLRIDEECPLFEKTVNVIFGEGKPAEHIRDKYFLAKELNEYLAGKNRAIFVKDVYSKDMAQLAKFCLQFANKLNKNTMIIFELSEDEVYHKTMEELFGSVI